MQIDNSGLVNYADMISGLHSKWKPHVGQKRVGRALLQDNCRAIFIQAGRNWGKTSLVTYLLWRWAKSNPYSSNYYFAPFMKQAREILWAAGQIQGFGPKEWIEGKPNNTEMRIPFTNKSFIKLDGSDNVDAYRGIKPNGLIIFDEFKDFREEFYEVFDPNRAAHDAPLIIIGTPPDREGQFLNVAKVYDEDSSKRFFLAPTEENPYISKEWLASKKKELYDRAEGDVWEREYMAKYVPGGVCKIFPMISKRHVRTHQDIMSMIERDKRKLEWFVIADPAASTAFGMLFIATNPYNKQIFILDEIFETDQNKMSVDQIGRRYIQKRNLLYEEEGWRQIYDEAETWFRNEVYDRFGEFFEPTTKQLNDKEYGLSLIKDVLLYDRVIISENCEHLFWEMDNYYKDKSGKIPKRNDHLIDCFRYFLYAANYVLTKEKEYVEKEDENFRGAKIKDDFPELDNWGEPEEEIWY